jgi:oligopeptide/dipeptide ABC transporter ATP-binding protein
MPVDTHEEAAYGMTPPDVYEPESLLEIEDVSLEFRTSRRSGGSRSLRALDGVSLTVANAQTVALVGESGSGKTTLGLAVMRHYVASKGSIRYRGVDISTMKGKELHAYRRQVQMIGQDPYASLSPRMRIRDIVAEPMKAHKLHATQEEQDAAVEHLVEQCGLPTGLLDRFPDALSGGQRQRVAIARALALRPTLVVADEPTSALDVSVQAQVLELLRTLKREFGVSYLFVSHNLAVVRQVADEVIVLLSGKIMERAKTEELYNRPLHPYTQSLLAAIPVPEPEAPFSFSVGSARTSRRDLVHACPFSDRCPRATEICRTEAPPLEEKTPGRWAACWHPDSGDDSPPKLKPKGTHEDELS